MIFGLLARRRKASVVQLDRAARPVIETLENRVLLSGSTHSVSHLNVATPHAVLRSSKHVVAKAASSTPVWSQAGSTQEKFAAFPIPLTGFAAPPGFTPAQIRQTYDLNTLDGYNPTFPLYTNTGYHQAIVIIGAPSPGLEGYYGNLSFFNDQFPAVVGAGGAQIVYVKGSALQSIVAAEPLTGVVVAPTGTDPYGDGAIDTTASFDQAGAVETAMAVEWASAMAPAAIIYLVEVNSVAGVVQPADLQLGIQKAIDILNPTTPDPLNPNGGGVVSMSVASAAEDPATVKQYDALFNQPLAKNISFIAPSGDTAGARSMPATSPYVTAVGGTVLRTDATGARLSETAWLYSGGGESVVEPRPAFQQLLPTNSKALRNTSTGRLVPDVSLISVARASGLSVYYDPIPVAERGLKSRHYFFSKDDGYVPADHGVNRPWANVTGTSVGPPVFAGMIADANEMRDSLGQEPLGQTLNQRLYDAFSQAPTLNYTDITAGNNAARNGPGHQAYKGYDLATGIGAPDANFLLPALAGVVASQKVNLGVRGALTLAFALPLSGNAVISFKSVGAIASVGTQNIGLNLTLVSNNSNVSGVLALPSITRNIDDASIDGFGTFTTTVTSRSATGIITTRTVVINVEVSGKVTGSGKKIKIKNGHIFTIDANLNRIFQGSDNVFEGTFSSI